MMRGQSSKHREQVDWISWPNIHINISLLIEQTGHFLESRIIRFLWFGGGLVDSGASNYVWFLLLALVFFMSM